MDTITRDARSANMRSIRSKDTSPEMIVRRAVHRMGYRYGLHSKNLPGKPDLVFRKRKKVIFVHGCFWHQHPLEGCHDARKPKSNTAYWEPKLKRNVERHAQNMIALDSAGWRVLVIWDCETKDKNLLISRLKKFLGKR